MNALPLVLSVATHVLLVCNVAALKISIESIVVTLHISSSAVKTALIAYALVVAACIMAGARLAATLGARRVFRLSLALFGGSMALMAMSAYQGALLGAQIVAGAAAAALIPASLIVLADHYDDEQRARAMAWVSAARSLSLAPAFLFAGAIAAWTSWRATYAAMVVLTAGIYFASERLRQRRGLLPRAPIDRQEALALTLIGVAVLIIGWGCDKLSDWGLIRARPDAPFSLLNLSPALLVIAGGAVMFKAALTWARRRCTSGPLFALQRIGAQRQGATLVCIFAIAAVGSGVTFLIPLYIEVVQGRSSLYTALALAPFTLASFAATLAVGRLVERFGNPQVARGAFVVVCLGLALLGAVVRNDWSDEWVITSLALIGFGEGALAMQLFTNLACVAAREVCEEVEPLCDATSHFAAAVGAAVAGAILIGVLSISVQRQLARDPVAQELRSYLDLDRVAFVSNDRLQQVLERSAATPERIAQAVRINTDARLFALKLSFFALAGLAAIAFVPIVRRQHRQSPQDAATHAGPS